MAMAYERLLQHRREGDAREYDLAMLQLYAVGIGLGMDPLDERQLGFLLEDRLQVMPSFATVAGFDMSFVLELGIEWSKFLHVSERLQLFAPLPQSARLRVNREIIAAFNKPAHNASLMVVRTTLINAQDDQQLAQIDTVGLARDYPVPDAPLGRPERLPCLPDRQPDREVTIQTSPQVALIYRQLGGRSLIHCDPKDARNQGFDGPIMHGLSTYGHVCHALVRDACDYDPARLRSFAADFSAPVYPGEAIQVRIWHESDALHFQARVDARDTVVLDNGFARLFDRETAHP
ncbi:MAG: acyl dehydratase [Gammaproteobacteria bacterium]|jgi:acyl dehydratase